MGSGVVWLFYSVSSSFALFCVLCEMEKSLILRAVLAGEIKAIRLGVIWVLASGLYWLNQWFLKPTFPRNHFFHWYFNDLLLPACMVPLILAIRIVFRERSAQYGISLLEAIEYWLLASVFFEIIRPYIYYGTSFDFKDILAYLVGTIVLWVLAGHWEVFNSGALLMCGASSR